MTEEGKRDPKSMKSTHFFRREYILNHMIGKPPGLFLNYNNDKNNVTFIAFLEHLIFFIFYRDLSDPLRSSHRWHHHGRGKC